MVKIRYSYRTLKNEPLKNRAEFNYEKMNGNAIYATYQPMVTELGALFAPFGTAIANCKLGGKDRTEAKNKIQQEIIAALNAIGRKLEDQANAKNMTKEEGEALIKGAGFDLVDVKGVSVKKVVTFLDTPTGFKVTDEKKQGSVLAEWNEQDDALTYLIQDLDADGHWQNTGVSEIPPIVLSGFTPKANRTFRLASISNGTVMSDYSEPVTVWIS